MPPKKVSDLLVDTIALAGKVVVDVGCGDGALVRVMAVHGAHVTGLEVNPAQLAAARAATPVADETYLDGVAQHLPLADGAAQLVVFSNSLHHVPVADQDLALAEAARVLAPGGEVFICEPLAEGSYFAVVRLVNDETEVRARALAAIRGAGRWGLTETREIFHTQVTVVPDFEEFRRRQIAVDPARAAIVAECHAELRAAFERHGQHGAAGWSFEQRMRINLLRK